MLDQKASKTGGILAILVGCFYLLFGLTFFLQPNELIAGSVEVHLSTLYHDSTMRTLYFLSWSFTGIFALGAVPVISEKFKHKNHVLVNWVRNLAMLGFAVTVIANLRAMVIKPMMANTFVNDDQMFQTIIPVIDPWLLLDLNGYLSLGAVGLWLLVINILSFKDNNYSKVFNIIGILGALSLFFAVIGASNPIISGIASGLGGIVFGPIWFIWVGINMIKHKKVDTSDAKINTQEVV